MPRLTDSTAGPQGKISIQYLSQKCNVKYQSAEGKYQAAGARFFDLRSLPTDLVIARPHHPPHPWPMGLDPTHSVMDAIQPAGEGCEGTTKAVEA